MFIRILFYAIYNAGKIASYESEQTTYNKKAAQSREADEVFKLASTGFLQRSCEEGCYKNLST